MYFKNVSGQGVYLVARDTVAEIGKTGIASLITSYISKDGAVSVEVNATSGTSDPVVEIGGGIYWCPLTQAELNANNLVLYSDSGTADVVVDWVIISTQAGAIPMVVFDTTGGIATYDQITTTLSNIADVQTGVDDIKGTGWSATYALSQSASLSEMNAEVDTALADIGLHKLTSEAVGTGTIADNSIIPALASDSGVWSGFSGATDSLEAIRDRGDAAWTGSGTGGGDASAANQTTIIGHLTDIQGGGFDSGDDSLEAIRNRGDAAWVTYPGPTGTGWPTPAQMWAHSPRTLTLTSEELYSVLDGTLLTLQRGDSLSVPFTGLGDISAYSKIWFTVKSKYGTTPDSSSQIQIMETTGTASSGLLYIGGGAPDDAANGSITIDDAADGDITIAVTAAEMAKIVPGSSYLYDVQMLDTSDDITTLTAGGCDINKDVTEASS